MKLTAYKIVNNFKEKGFRVLLNTRLGALELCVNTPDIGINPYKRFTGIMLHTIKNWRVDTVRSRYLTTRSYGIMKSLAMRWDFGHWKNPLPKPVVNKKAYSYRLVHEKVTA